MTRYFILAAALPLVIVLNGCTQNGHAAPSPEPTPVRAHKAALVTFAEQQRYAATAEPQAQLDLVFRTAGVVTSLYTTAGRPLEPGDTVPAGAVLAQLRATEFEARVASADAALAEATAGRTAAEAQVREAQAAARQAQADLRRAEALYQSQAMTRAELDAVRARHEASQARLQAANTNVEGFDARIRAASAARSESRVPLADTTITAPFPGIIVARRIERGSSVVPGSLAYTIADLRQVKLSFGVPDTALPEFAEGRAVRATVEALPGERFTGRVIGVSPAADPVNRLFRVQAFVPNPGARLKAGMVASVVMETPDEKPFVAVPLRAIRRLGDNAGQFAVLVVEGGRVQTRPVALGPSQGALIAVASGLRAGETVVEDAGTRINAGDAVRIIE